MPAQRQTRVQTRLRNARSMALVAPGIELERSRSPQPPPWEDINLFGTSPSNSFTTPTREALLDPARTEPSTPDSPSNRAARDRTLKRERSVHSVQVDVQAVLHFDRSENDLQPWHWPVNEAGERVTPSNLLEHRRSYDFRGPSCFCASLSSDESAYTEASIFMAKSGPSAGGYVAACATGLCRYWVSLEQLYNRRGLLLRRYPCRLTTSCMTSAPSTPKSQSKAAHRLRDIEEQIGSVVDLVTQDPWSSNAQDPFAPAKTDNTSVFTPSDQTESIFGLLLQLDSISDPGITEESFKDLFMRCLLCRRHMTRRTTAFHRCEVTNCIDVADLVTGE